MYVFTRAATLQKKNRSNDLPLVIRIETRDGHGAGKLTTRIIEEQTDIWSLMFFNIGIRY